jgi:type IV pilus assembly protein PilY1
MNKALLLAGLAFAMSAGAASAQAVITNGTIGLGINPEGHLNMFPDPEIPSAGGTTPYGLRDLRTGWEATAPGCLCEGWGVSDGIIDSAASVDTGGVRNMTVMSFVTTATTATSVVDVGGVFEVTHAFKPTADINLYEAVVTIKNISGAAVANTFYRRGMDWDIEPTAFDEFVTIAGTAAATAVVQATDDGFCDVSPLSSCGFIVPGGIGDFTDLGPEDHGATFDFNFGALGIDESVTFSIFYGAAPTEFAALSALAAVGAEVYSLGQSVDDPKGTRAGYSTFIFGFKGVGGVIIDPPVIPEPGTWAMMIAGFGLVGYAARRRRRELAA